MPTFPPFKTKPYYESLKSWLFTSHNEDGTLRSDAVQAEVAAAIANTDTYVAAADDAIAAELASNPNLAAVNSPGTEGEALTVVGGVPDWAPVPSVAAVTALQASASRLESRVATYSVHDPASGTVAVGDGVTDDYAAIQARLSGLPTTPVGASGGKVELQPGHVYGISQTLEITLPNTDLDGIVGGTLTDSGACTIKALPGFTGPLLRVNIPSGSKGAWIRNLRLDGNNEAGVTAGVEYAYGTISVAHMFDVAISNVPTGIDLVDMAQSLIFERVLAFDGIEVGVNIGRMAYQIIFGKCRIGGTQWAAIVGVDNAVAADHCELIVFDACELYARPGATGAVLLRNVENPRIINSYVEAEATLASTIPALVQVGTGSTSAVRTPVITGNRFGGNGKADFGVDIVNAFMPFVAYNGGEGLNTGIVTQTMADTNGVLMGGSSGWHSRHVAPIQTQTPSGSDVFQAWEPGGEPYPRLAMRSGNISLYFGGGWSPYDVQVFRNGAGRLQINPGVLRLEPRAAPASGIVGDLYMTLAGKLMVCTATGTPGTWVAVGTQT